jgi:hypothetical protein
VQAPEKSKQNKTKQKATINSTNKQNIMRIVNSIQGNMVKSKA